MTGFHGFKNLEKPLTWKLRLDQIPTGLRRDSEVVRNPGSQEEMTVGYRYLR